MDKLQMFLFVGVSVALVASFHKKAYIASVIAVAVNFIAGHLMYGGFGWLTLLNFVCLSALLVSNRLVGSKWFSACSILIYSVAIDVLCFCLGMAHGAPNLFEYVWAGIVFNAPKLLITLPVAVAWQLGEFITKHYRKPKLMQATT